MVVPDLDRGYLLLITFTPKYFHGVAPVIGLQHSVRGNSYRWVINSLVIRESFDLF